MKTARFAIEPRGPFSVDSVRELQCGFLRGTRSCGAGSSAVTVAFPEDETFQPVAVRLGWTGRRLEAEVFGSRHVERIERQVARMLALDHDATPFAACLEADPALRPLAAARAGFRPVVAPSPYVMAAWCVLSQRWRMSQAAAVQVRLSEAAGDAVEVHGERVASFPQPRSILDRAGFPGIPDEKWQRLQAVARAAHEGQLDRDRLVGMPYQEAHSELRRIHGVGEWTAHGILVRGCGLTDVLPLSERTLHGAVQLVYGLPRLPSDAQVEAIAEAWRPFRTWVSVLVISHDFGAARARTRSRERPRVSMGRV